MRHRRSPPRRAPGIAPSHRLWASVGFLLFLSIHLGCSTPQSVQTIRAADGNASLYVEENVYTFRRNNWSFFSWIHSGATTGNTPRVLIHLDSHSDMHPAPVCKDADGLAAGSLEAAESYTTRLSISSFILPAIHYGFVDEVYWVQPPITPYRAPPETVAFSLAEAEGWIRPEPRAEAGPLDQGRWSIRSFRAEDVPRSLDVAIGAGYAAEDWAPGPATLHCLSLDQLLEKIEDGDLERKDILLDLDLDYFGTTGPLRGYGYMTFGSGHVALGVLGGTLPIFHATRESQIREVRRIGRVVRALSPHVVTVSESPDHAHREDLPFLVGLVRDELLGSGREVAAVHSVSLRYGSESTVISPTCPEYVDLGGADTVRFVLSRDATEGPPLDVALYHNPAGSDDRLVLRTWLAPGDSLWTLPVPSGPQRTSWLGPGWELDIRSADDGRLLWTAGFCLDENLVRLRTVLGDLAGEGLAVSRDPLSYAGLNPSRIISEGRAAGLDRDVLHRILLAHPRIFYHQCRNLEQYRKRAGTVELDAGTRR